MWHVIADWVMIVVGAGSVLLGMVFGAASSFVRFARWLQDTPRQAPRASVSPVKASRHRFHGPEATKPLDQRHAFPHQMRGLQSIL